MTSLEHGCRNCASLDLKTLETPGSAVSTLEVLCLSCGAQYVEGVADGHTTIVWLVDPVTATA